MHNEDDAIEFMQDLPEKLRMELSYKIHLRTTSNILFMKDRPKDFIATVGSLLRPFRVDPGQFIYQAGEPVLEVYFLCKGSASFVLP